MSSPDSDSARLGSELAERAAALRRFDGSPQEFWPAFLELAGRTADAVRAVLIRKDTADKGRWKQMAEWAAPDTTAAGLALFRNALLSLAEHTERDGIARKLLATPTDDTPFVPAGLAVRLALAAQEETCLVALFLPQAGEAAIDSALQRVQLVADVPQSYQEHSTVEQARHDVEKFAVVLDTLAQVNAQTRYVAAALALCNSLASRLHCRRVSFGWHERSFIHLQATSRTERFDRKMAAVQALEKVMEECFDQDDEILWPSPPDYALINRDHEAFARDNHAGSVCSIPVRRDGKPVGVITLERDSGGFTEIELQQLRLCADQVVFRLHDLKRRDRWWGARLVEAARETAANLLGPEHTWMKVTGAGVAVLLAMLFFLKLNYRVEADYILRSHEVRYVTAPFAGYLQEVLVRPGDPVKAGDVVLRLNTDDLLLEEAAGLAEQSRFQREAEKARANNQLAEMRVAQSQLEEVKARLALVRYRLGRAELKAPFDGVVVEGDLRSRLGSPIEQGEALVRLARTDTLYIEAEVNERDIHEVLDKSTGEIAFTSQPRKKYPVRIERIEPAGLPKEGKNVFLARCTVEGRPEEWWRPGMTGVCKLNVGERRLIWILTHRTVDFLRLWLWW